MWFCVAALASPWAVELDFTAPDVEQRIADLGGVVHGGVFGPDGWTTTARTDRIEFALPPGIDAEAGTMSVSLHGFEYGVTPDYWEQWAVLALDDLGPPLRTTPTGTAAIWTLYRGFDPDDPTRGYRPTGYVNLSEPSCDDWHDCTGEASAPHHFLLSGAPLTATTTWDGTVTQLTFEGANTVSRTVDLSDTSAGVVAADTLWWMINPCGGSTSNACGPWNGPNGLMGGPIGVTYTAASLALEGPCPEPDDTGIAAPPAPRVIPEFDLNDVGTLPPLDDGLDDGRLERPGEPSADAVSGCQCGPGGSSGRVALLFGVLALRLRGRGSQPG